MLVYHGSHIAVVEPKIIPTRRTKDFGAGFYCTLIREQAERWARRFDTPIVSRYQLRIDETLDILEFHEMTEEWLDFIITSRSGTPHGHDIVIGAMADDQIYNYISDYMEGIITRSQFWALAKFKYPTHQILFATERALECLTFLDGQEVEP